MKYNISNLLKASLAVASVGSLTGCSDSFLEQDPLSFYEPSVTYSTVAGLESALSQCDSQLKFMVIDGNGNMLTGNTNLFFSDMGLYAKTDAGSAMMDDMAGKITPTSGMASGGDSNAMMLFWDRAWDGIKYANTVLTYIDEVKGLDDATRGEYKGRAYFHRAYHYYNLCLQFGDIPLVTKLPSVAKNNYTSTSKEAIMKMLAHDLEFAVENVKPQKQQNVWGVVNQEGCLQLLTKVYLCLGEWAKAEATATELINNHGLALMQNSFGTFVSGNDKTWPITRNVIWDLKRGENILDGANTETIMPILNFNDQQFTSYVIMRSNGVHWSNGIILDPNGLGGPSQNYARNNGNYNEELDWLRAIGRGIGCCRTSKYFNGPLWSYNGEMDWQDLRHNREVGNWLEMEDIKYNNPSSRYYGQNMRLYVTEDTRDNDGHAPWDINPETGNAYSTKQVGDLLCTDTIRSWYPTPLWVLYYKDQSAEENMGANQFNGVTKGSSCSNGNMYLYRLAETYLLRAEARLYQGKKGEAAEDVNAVRQRANAKHMFTAADINIGVIADERGRELYLEEWRQPELARISWCLARSGVQDEFGNTYSLDTWDKQDGTDLSGGSYWYQRCINYNIFNHGAIISGTTLNYRIDKHNLFWPVPNKAITANYLAPLRQNYGYDGYDANTPMFTDWEEAVADETKN